MIMKKIIWLSIIILSVNLLFFPKKAETGSLNQSTGNFFKGVSSIYLAPIWSKSYSSHLISFVPSNTSVWDSTDLDGNKKSPKLAIGIWIIFFLIPSAIIFYLSVFYKKNRNKSLL
jgi:hypothetical protein